MERVLLVFNTTHDALKAEQLLEKAAIPFCLQPVPGSIQSGCGLGITLAPEQHLLAAETLDKDSLQFKAWKLFPNRAPGACDC